LSPTDVLETRRKGTKMKSKILGMLAATMLAAPMSAQAVLVGELEQTAPFPTTYTDQVDTGVFSYSAVGDVTASVQAVDLMLGLGNASTSGPGPLERKYIEHGHRRNRGGIARPRGEVT
jgi:hypothetical protein